LIFSVFKVRFAPESGHYASIGLNYRFVKRTVSNPGLCVFILSESTFPYCIPDKRELTSLELELLKFPLEQVDDVSVAADEPKIRVSVAD
jgi:hypothetical protein